MDKNEIEEIVLKQLNGKRLSAEEEAVFENWLGQAENKKRYYELKRLQAAIYANTKVREVVIGKAWKSINRRISPLFLRQVMKYVAVLLILAGTGVAFYQLQKPQAPLPLAKQSSVETGRPQPVLTLSNGMEILLNDSIHQTVTQENGIIIRQDSLNTLIYDHTAAPQEEGQNTLYIPRGGEYKLVLSDGSSVWLNSDSRLSYPIAFKGNTRELYLEGEAFFEVAKDESKPFIVHTRQFDIRVTGTQFNVRSYKDEPESATLTQGQIQLERGEEVHPLVPGQQALLEQEQIKIRKVNPEEAIAWRYDAFCFKQQRLENMLNELARWYDVEIFYLNPKIKDLHFTAWFRRSSSLEEVIEVLKKTQKISVELKGKTLMIKE